MHDEFLNNQSTIVCETAVNWSQKYFLGFEPFFDWIELQLHLQLFSSLDSFVNILFIYLLNPSEF